MRNQFLELLSNVRYFKTKKNGRSPHKALLLLWYLAKLQSGSKSVSFEETEREFTPILLEFGKFKKKNAHEPFWRLQGDGLWEVTSRNIISTNEKGGVNKGSLLASEATGTMPQIFREHLSNSPGALVAAAQHILNDSFPETLHDDILYRIGLSLDDNLISIKRKRDPIFRKVLLERYQYRCAICDCGFQLGGLSHPVIEAAHIQWHAAGGPDIMQNGLALCNFHHKLFDRGAITLNDHLETKISPQLTSVSDSIYERWIGDFAGKPIRLPRENSEAPELKYIEWHRREVFLD